MLCVVTEETERVIGERRLAHAAAISPRALVAPRRPSRRLSRRVERSVGANGRATCRSRCSTSSRATGDGSRSPARRASSRATAAAPATIDLSDGERPGRRRRAGDAGSRSRQRSARRCGRCRPAPGRIRRAQASSCPMPRQGIRPPPASWWTALNPFRRSTRPMAVSSTGGRPDRGGLANAHAYEAERARAEALAESTAPRRRSSPTSATSSARR